MLDENVEGIGSQNELVASRAVQAVGDVTPKFALYRSCLPLPDETILAHLSVGGVGVVR